MRNIGTVSHPPGTVKLLFESTTCSRCGGTGSYSYCTMYGSRCFKCGGAGCYLTKRGKAAQAFLDDLRSVPVANLKVGDLIRVTTYSLDGSMSMSKFEAVEAIEHDVPGSCSFTLDGVTVRPNVTKITTASMTQHVAVDSTVRLGQTAEQKKETRARALAYQATLTKTGKATKATAAFLQPVSEAA